MTGKIGQLNRLLPKGFIPSVLFAMCLYTPGVFAATTADLTAASAALDLVRQFSQRVSVSQAAEGMDSQVAPASLNPRSAPMRIGEDPSIFPNGISSIPPGLGVPRRDGAGRMMGYCAWDNQSATAQTTAPGRGYLGGLNNPEKLVYAIVSPGKNGMIDTTCEEIIANVTSTTPERGVGDKDDFVFIRRPSQIRNPATVISAPNLAALQARQGVAGDLGLTLDNRILYTYNGSTWVSVAAENSGPGFTEQSGGNISYTGGSVTVNQFIAGAATFSSNVSVTGTANITGDVTASSFSGSGAGLTSLNATNISTGTLAVARGGTGLGTVPGVNQLLIGTGSAYELSTLTAGAGVGITNTGGVLTLSNTGVLSVSSPLNTINVNTSNGAATIELPQAIATTSTPTFGGMLLNGDLTGTTATFTGAVTAPRLNVWTTAGGVVSPNMIIGLDAMPLAQSGNGGNTAVGAYVLYANDTGYDNTALGKSALYANTSGYANDAIGVASLASNTTGNRNSALGSLALYGNTTGGLNVAVGHVAGMTNTTGVDNVFVGVGAGNTNTTGYGNTFVGRDARPTTGSLNNAAALGAGATVATSNTLALGRAAGSDQVVIGTDTRNDTTSGTRLYVNGRSRFNGDLYGTAGFFSGTVTVGSISALRLDVSTNAGGVSEFNLIVGNGALPLTQSGSGANTAVGIRALESSTSGSANGAFGTKTLRLLNTGNNNTALGAYALDGLTSGSNNTALGSEAGSQTGTKLLTQGSNNTLVGAFSGPAAGANTLDYATTLGAYAEVATSNTIALGRNSTADQVVIGTDTRNDTTANTKLYVNGPSRFNGGVYGTTATFSGNVSASKYLIADSLNNVSVGSSNLVPTQSGSGGNVALGFSAMQSSSSGYWSVGIGNAALMRNTTGGGNVAVGFNVLSSNTANHNNTGVGSRALENADAGGNTAVGHWALINTTSGGGNTAVGDNALASNTTGGNNSALGNGANVSSGNLNYATAIGAATTVATSNTIALGRNSTADQVVIGTDTRNDTTANTKLYVNGPSRFNGGVYGTTLDLTGALTGTTGTFSGTLTVGSISAPRLDISTSAGGVFGPNMIIGTGAMPLTQSGLGRNTALGVSALSSNSTGANNVAVGFQSLYNNTTGSENVAVGKAALYNNTTGEQNQAFGAGALSNNTTGIGNSAVGYWALLENTTGSLNTAISPGALQKNTTGENNTATGFQALYSNTTGTNNVALGYRSGFATAAGSLTKANVTGSNNTFLGSSALPGTSTQLNYATALGSESTVSTSNTIALGRNSTADQVVIGTDTRDDTTANTKLYVNGLSRFNGDLYGTTATFSTSVNAPRLDTTDSNFNTPVGVQALASNTTGTSNIAVGYRAMRFNTTGAQNQAVGASALTNNTSGNFNTAMGYVALLNNTTGSTNTGIATAALQNNTTGYDNNAIGYQALVSNTTGYKNVALGVRAGSATAGGNFTNANVTGSNNTFLGSFAVPGTTTQLNYATALGAESTVSTSNTIALGRNSTADQVVIGTDTRNDTTANTKLYVNGPSRFNGGVYGTTLDLTGSLTGTTGTFSGTVTANAFSGNGSALTALNASNISTGTLNVARGGTGVDGSAAANGALLIGNGTGYTLGTLTGTANQINVSNGAGSITLSLPQSIASTSTPTFGGMTLNGGLTGTTGTFSGAVTVGSLIASTVSAPRLDISTSAGGVTNPNLIIGTGAMPLSQSGAGRNTAMGVSALAANTTGVDNTAVGFQTLYSNTSGIQNIAVGRNALYANTAGDRNIAIGYLALSANTSGSANQAIGSRALENNTTGNNNYALGYMAMNANTTGGNNTATGNNALQFNTTGTNNMAMGNSALRNNTTGNNNMGVGVQSLLNNTTGSNNTAVGASAAGLVSATGSNNTFVGYDTDVVVDGVSYSTAIGSGARVATNNTIALGRNSTADQVVIGTDTRNDTTANTKLYVNGPSRFNGGVYGTTLDLTGALTGTTGTFSGTVTVGSISAPRLDISTSAGGVSDPNLIIGTGAMPLAQSGGGRNTAVGYSALQSNTSGRSGTALGYNALKYNTTGYGNTAVGVRTLGFNTTGNGNSAFGGDALVNNTSGVLNVAVGLSALELNTTGSNNTGLGYQALMNNTTGSNNLVMGYAAGLLNSTGSNNTFVGANSGSTVDALSYATSIGASSTVATSNTIALGRNSTADQVVIGTDTRNDTTANTKLYVNGPSRFNGSVYGTTLDLTGALTGTTGTFSGTVTANAFSGNGSALTALNASNISTGTLNVARGGTGVDGSAAANGALLIGNGTGYTLGTLTGTANQINVSNGAGSITLSLPQSVATTSTPTFGGMTLNGGLTGTTGTFSGAVTAQRLIVSDSSGGVSTPNIAVGTGNFASSQSGSGGNLAIGVSALAANLSGRDNLAIGLTALAANTYGSDNIVIGNYSLPSNTFGSSNTAIGNSVLGSMTDGSYNTAIGEYALSSATTSYDNTAIGWAALLSNTTGGKNVAVGELALSNSTIGSYNTALGYNADLSSLGLNISYATAIGSDSTVATSNTIALGRNSASDQVVIGTDTRNGVHKLYVNGTALGTAWNTTSDRRLKTDISTLNTDDVLTKLGQFSAHRYRYIANPEIGFKIGVIAQDVEGLFPEVAGYNGGRFLSVDYNALGAMAAVGVGQLNKKVLAIEKDLLEVKLVNERVKTLETWRESTDRRMDTMQAAIESNLNRLAENILQTEKNTASIKRLDEVLVTVEADLKEQGGTLKALQEKWAKTFSASEDGRTLRVQAQELTVSNFTAEQARISGVYALRLEAEMAKIRELEVESLKVNKAVANNVQAQQVNTGSVQVYAGVGSPAILFSASSDGHYTVNTSALDGSYATATVIVNAGQAKVVNIASEGIELTAVGNTVKAIAAGKSIKASWIKTG